MGHFKSGLPSTPVATMFPRCIATVPVTQLVRANKNLVYTIVHFGGIPVIFGGTWSTMT